MKSKTKDDKSKPKVPYMFEDGKGNGIFMLLEKNEAICLLPTTSAFKVGDKITVVFDGTGTILPSGYELTLIQE